MWIIFVQRNGNPLSREIQASLSRNKNERHKKREWKRKKGGYSQPRGENSRAKKRAAVHKAAG